MQAVFSKMKDGVSALPSESEAKSAASKHYRYLAGLDFFDTIFYIALSGWLLWKMSVTTVLSLPVDSGFNTVIHFGLLFLFALSMAKSFSVDANLLFAVVFGAVGLAIKASAGDVMFFDLAVIFWAGNRFGFRRIAKVSLVVVGAAFFVVVALAVSGAIYNYPVPKGDVVRYGLGFLWCTLPNHYYLEIVMLYVFLKRGKLSGSAYLLICTVNIALYMATLSRNSFLLVFLFLFTVLVVQMRKEDSGAISFFQNCAKWSFVVLACISFIVVGLYDADDAAWQKANEISSNRLTQTQGSLAKYDVTPFGDADIELIGNALVPTEDGFQLSTEAQPEGDTNYIDNSYMKIWVNNGFVILLLILFMATQAGRSAVRSKNLALSAVLLVFAIQVTVDDPLMVLQYNVFVFVFWQASVAWLEEKLPLPEQVAGREKLRLSHDLTLPEKSAALTFSLGSYVYAYSLCADEPVAATNCYSLSVGKA